MTLGNLKQVLSIQMRFQANSSKSKRNCRSNMELIDKKYLAEWLYGHEVCPEGWLTSPRGNEYINDGMYCPNFVDWNPDTDHKQFAEVRHNISDFVWERIKEAYFSQHLSERQGNFEDAILFYLPKVMEAVLEVIRDEVKE